MSRRELPRNYVEILEQRLAYLEGLLERQRLQPSQDVLLNPNTATHIEQPTTLGHAHPQSSGDAEELQDLASKVGTLSLNAAGAEPHYLGSSSTFAFARLIKPILNQVSLAAPESQTDYGPASGCATPTMCQLPDPTTAVTLSNAYFENIHTQYPFLSETDFRKWESSIVLLQGDYEQWTGANFSQTPFFFLNMVWLSLLIFDPPD